MRERAFRDQVMDEMLPWRRPPGAALDVGCGAGRLLPRLAAVGWKPHGLEWDPEAARVARAETDFPVHVGSARRMDSRLGPFDLVTLVHVFEHLADPVDALAHLGGRLTDDGRLVLIYPNPESLMARGYGPDWFGWEVPRHLTLLPGRALRLAAERAGLRLRTFRTVTRWAAAFSWQSRALRRGAPRDAEALLEPQPTVRDRVLG
jgi:2-polyprenyl-3-methyl-5-hydroxy-6-metoxy-1,4-benzoquinol methylase